MEQNNNNETIRISYKKLPYDDMKPDMIVERVRERKNENKFVRRTYMTPPYYSAVSPVITGKEVLEDENEESKTL